MEIFLSNLINTYKILYHQNSQEKKIIFSKIYHNFVTLRINNMDFKKYWHLYIYLFCLNF